MDVHPPLRVHQFVTRIVANAVKTLDLPEVVSISRVQVSLEGYGAVDELRVSRGLKERFVVSFKLVVRNREIKPEFLVVRGESFDFRCGLTRVCFFQALVQFFRNVHQNAFTCKIRYLR